MGFGGGYGDSPDSEKRLFSPYSSQYNSPVSATEARAQGRVWEEGRREGEGGMVAGEGSAGAGTGTPDVERPVPVVRHPGLGRGAGV